MYKKEKQINYFDLLHHKLDILHHIGFNTEFLKFLFSESALKTLTTTIHLDRPLQYYEIKKKI